MGRSAATRNSWPPTGRPSATAAPRRWGCPTTSIAQLSALQLASGTAPTSPHEVVMDAGTAQKYHFVVGDHVRVLLAGPPQTFTISGIVKFGTANNLAGATIAAFELPTAQRLFGQVGHYQAIDVLTAPGADKATVQHAIAADAPEGRGGGDRADRGERAVQRHQSGAGLLLHRPPGVRLHLALRRRLHDLQHVLHHRRSAHTGAGAVAHRRRQSPSGLPLGPGRGPHSGHRGLA